jgi:alkylhydroperoxidase/carboxymuconolactone decarboxylase family protein YurZ
MKRDTGNGSVDARTGDAARALDQYASGILSASAIETRGLLPEKMRRLVAITALLADSRSADLSSELRQAVAHGVTPSELLDTLRVASQCGVHVPVRAIEELRDACGDA